MIVIVILFALMLTAFRLQWIKTFNETTDQPIIEKGELDLRGWDFSNGQTISLDGEWAFYPYEHIMSESTVNGDPKKQYIHVPGDWSDTLNPADGSPYGYGSYRLRILVDADQHQTYSMQVPSVRSSSALYSNGLYSGKSGEVADNEKDAHAFNVPYVSSSIRADDNGVIEIVLQATNFEDPRSSGLVRSLRFGYEESIQAASKLSTLLQVISGGILAVHALFAGILYSIGIRNRRLLYFALVLAASAVSNTMGGDEKVLLDYLEMNYTASFKLSFSLLIIYGWAMVQCVKPQIQSLATWFLPVYTAISVGAIVVGIMLPLESLSFASAFSLSYVVISAFITVFALLLGGKEYKGSIWLAFSGVALASHIGWWIYALQTGLKVIYYPFDMMIAVICFSGVWFKQYHNMNMETKKLAAELQKADKVKDEFLVNTSHELRNPLHSILNISQAVLEREHSSLQGRSAKELETVLSISRRMSLMVDELLEMTYLKEGTPQIQLHPCSLQAVTVGVVDMLDYMIKGKPVQVVNKIPDDFPLVMADEKRLIQIIFNLLHNAIKFTHHGTITIRVLLQENEAKIEITDTGVGMEEEVIRTIFEPYAQEHRGEGGGFGLGLNISQKLVELHGDTLRVHSVLGEGSTFSFTIPLANLAENVEVTRQLKSTMPLRLHASTREESGTVEAPAEPSFERPRILVVDDDPVNLQVIETIFSEEDYTVVTVLSGEEALVLLDGQEWDLVISDVMMPNMSGYDLTKRVRQRFSLTELPILLLTARSHSFDIENGFLAGANDYVKKPVDALEFKSRVRALTSVKQSMNEKVHMESAWLQAQIQPHFLFNALNTILALSEIDLKRMQQVVEAFSHLLRRKFQFHNVNMLSPIEEEIGLVTDYLLIEKERFQDRLHVIWEIDNDLNVALPALTIQPLVENAIHHGLMKRIKGGTLRICIAKQETSIEIVVEDDGVGMEESFIKEHFEKEGNMQSGIGLVNTNLRLKRHYGQGLQIKSTPGVGTTVSFRVPL